MLAYYAKTSRKNNAKRNPLFLASATPRFMTERISPEHTLALTRDMPTEEFRSCGQQTLDYWIANYLKDPPRYKVQAKCQPGDLRDRLPASGPEDGESMQVIWRDFGRVTFWNHPHFHAYFSISSSAPGILGEMLIAALDANAMLWKSCHSCMGARLAAIAF